jgi:hypothetical protein
MRSPLTISNSAKPSQINKNNALIRWDNSMRPKHDSFTFKNKTKLFAHKLTALTNPSRIYTRPFSKKTIKLSLSRIIINS